MLCARIRLILRDLIQADLAKWRVPAGSGDQGGPGLPVVGGDQPGVAASGARPAVDAAGAAVVALAALAVAARGWWWRRRLPRRWRRRRTRRRWGGRGGPGGRGGRGGQNAAFIGNRARRSANQIRTQLFFTARNSAFDARPFSLNGQDQVKSSYANNRYGLNIGGPLIIPKLFDASKILNFTVTYNGDLARNPYDATATLANATERSGNFAGRNTILRSQYVRRPEWAASHFRTT